MLKHERQVHIGKFLSENGFLGVSQLSDRLGVSEATIRRDLAELAQKGMLKRTHGGAIVSEKASPEPPVMQRAQEHSDIKSQIGRKAASLIQEGETVFIGSGTTALEVARHLTGRQNITVITNAVTVINVLAQETGITVISTGGMLRPTELSLIGHLSEQVLSQFRPRKAFVGIRAISLTEGLTNDYIPEIGTDRIIFQSAPEIVLVADHSKFGKISTAFVAPVTAVHHVVTDDKTPNDIIEQLRKVGINVLVC